MRLSGKVDSAFLARYEDTEERDKVSKHVAIIKILLFFQIILLTGCCYHRMVSKAEARRQTHCSCAYAGEQVYKCLHFKNLGAFSLDWFR